jgi:ubiquinone/menaquinone biosynthesis C-methylase UbiE
MLRRILRWKILREGMRRRILLSIRFLLRTAYHLLYYPFAFLYDLAAWIVSAGEWADWRRCILPHLPPGRILEAAHGTGTLALEIAAQEHAVVAFDLSPAMNRIAKRKHLAALRKSICGIDPANPAYLRADIFRLPLARESFAGVVCTFPSDFVADPVAIREVSRVLQPGGKWLIVPTAYPRWLSKTLRRQSNSYNISTFEQMIRKHMETAGLRLQVTQVERPHSTVVIWILEKIR